jgi:hypothetical protein
MTPLLKAIDLEDDGIAGLTFDTDLGLGAG